MGRHKNETISIATNYEAVGSYSVGKITKEELQAIECSSCPGLGACPGMFTANTMAMVVEAMGMSVPGSSSLLAADKENKLSPGKKQDVQNSIKALLEMLKRGIRARDIMTKEAFENGITTLMAVGGSTNGILHLLALAKVNVG